MDPEQARTIALALAGATERDHHGFPSFRARTIFATMPDPRTLRIMLPEPSIREAVAEFPAWASVAMWGKQVAAIAVDLPSADARVVAEWLDEAHRHHG
ncbi:hypothetical protein C6I20_06080 [Aeromicrobium sp. A1-2]|uniref:MmcQ/YjbR family DNA-binding protein n=1 Tax=Aeromicrobium sp. A1-2 TaxID=2107713 RepID=UPI000E4F8EE5|nr:MmcQ/YjbR family DNA-binding protein [Aeromicrobium sp. A1-2]AXT84802.1 hypothetical protein C6I20_06080 [Aeromicrobium sp. A1-2]